MTTRVNPHQGTWELDEGVNHVTQAKNSSFLEANKGKIIAICTVVFFAIGALAAGGLLLHFRVNTITAWASLGSGGALAIGALVTGVVIYIRHRKTKRDPSQQSHYSIVSWNIGVQADYSRMCAIKNQMREGKNFPQAFDNACATYPPYKASEEEKQARVGLFQESFQQFGNPDIICLQETWEMKVEEIQEILPKGYSFFSYKNTDGCDCTIVWNTEKFSKIGNAKLLYDPEYIPSRTSAPDTIALLKDNDNGTTICVGSAHLRGFSLAYETLDERSKNQELTKALSGDNQTRYDLATMDAVEADLYIFAGDFNVTPELYQPRFDIIKELGYTNDASDSAPTIYNADLWEDEKGPQPVKLDHIFVKGQKGSKVEIESLNLPRSPLNGFNRPSDHLPVGAKITYQN